MDKYALIEKINSIEGLTDEERDALTALLREHKKYGLVWEEKTEKVEERMRDTLPVLQEVKDRAIVSGSPDAPNHILIEGDNLEALTALSYTHSGKIDVIYIDPPYNTGKKDFAYNDSFVEKENEYRHSTWLSFTYKRLTIAKQLLSDRGVIFISIDDNEFAQLKLMCNEIFSEYNFLGEIVWETATDNNPTQISTVHEFVICYAKRKSVLEDWSVTSDKAQLIKQKYDEIIASGITEIPEVRKTLKKWINAMKKSNEVDLSGVSHYDYVDEKGVFYPGNSANTKPGGYTFDIIHPITKQICKKPTNGYRWTEATFWAADKVGDVLWGEDENTIPKIKKRIETATELLKSCYYEDGRAATAALGEILGGKKFNNPKPLRLISKIINFSSHKDSVILDFFAGSGTTLHAVMQLNEKDKGHRQCILVQKKESNENNICEVVTYVRNKRVIEGYTTPKGERVEGLTRNNLRYYKTEMLPREQTVHNRRRLMSAATDLLYIKNDLYKEEDEFGGKPLNKRAARCFSEGKRTMLVIYNELTVDAFAETIRSMDVEERIMIYVFSLNRYPQTDNFCEVLDKVELCALPAAIYDAYRHVLPDREKRKKGKHEAAMSNGGQING